MRTCVRMRWDELRVDNEAARRLPGYRDGAVVRRFDAPEALQTRFYEVRARSALNRVPEQSQVPFRWTINPYRGCSHACVYCVAGDTPILMADGRTKTIADVRVGDEIYGTVRRGAYRRYAITRVLAHWSTVKPAHRITLADGTQLVASGSHRFLTARGWKHVTGAEQGRRRRPHLTVNDKLIGTGRFAQAPEDRPEYRRGYLCGILRGDGHIGSYSYQRPGRSHGDVHRFRLALTDLEALRRTRDYLEEEEIATTEWIFRRAAGAHREMTAIGSSSGSIVERAAGLVEWPASASEDWCRGFLAGIFDAEGCRSAFALRISNTDPEILAWTERCARRLGFDVAIELTGKTNGLKVIRIRGGLSEHLRFFHMTDPAITRKRSIEGEMVKTFSNLRVA